MLKKFHLILAVVITLLSFSTFFNSPSSLSNNIIEYQVTRIIDGDTIEVDKIGKVRYIGINTPELHHPTKGKEPFATEACIANTKLVLGKKVRLEYDVQTHDRYGRVLAYVYVGKIFVNAYLVEHGYAQVMTVPPNVKYSKLFQQLQQKARKNQAGLWGIHPDPETPITTGKYLASIKSDKYHLPNCKWAQKISQNNRLWFNTKKEAEAKGYKPCSECKP
ncbi:MAG TPA: thermonuclease family protein [Bacillota bacterium]|jgi:micrococcal nuclease|nr:thermonuclease family protein [Bacillota bacterium]HOL11115.1 thermonuclease family protein [Bacillota bacterium]HPO98838.1 thermonuclease family protein [Bacillota bacterium]